MNFTPVLSAMSRFGLQLQKHAPTILASAGTIGVIGTAVMASKATLKLEETIEPHVKDLARVNKAVEEDRPGYSKEDALSDKTKLYTRIAMDVTKLYAPAIAIGIATLGMFWGGNRILARRNASLMAAYGLLNTAYEKLRSRVTEEFGEEGLAKVEKIEAADLRAIAQKEDEHVDMGENGVRLKNPYCQTFGIGNHNWRRDPWHNTNFLNLVETHCNDMLKARGHLFLNEVYDALGLERTAAGAVTGWVLGEGDGYVDFRHEEGRYETEGVFDGSRHIVSEYLINPNVQGLIWDKI